MGRGKNWFSRLIVAVAVLALQPAIARSAPQVRPTRILLLYALAPDAPSAPPLIERLRTTILRQVKSPVEFYVEYLDLDRFPDVKEADRLTRYIAEKYAGFGIDAVVAMGSMALDFATQRLHGDLAGVPIVFGLAYEFAVDTAALPRNVTGRVFSVSLGRTLTMARRLQPNLRRVFVVAGSSAIDSLAMRDALGSIGDTGENLEIVVRQGLPFEQLRKELQQLPSNSMVFFAHFRRDGLGQIFVPQEAFGSLAHASRVPTYSYVDPMLERGVLGGAMARNTEEGARVADLLVRVLRNPRGSPLPPVERVESPFAVDWRTLKRFNLDERRLPAGTDVRFREPSLWERYQSVIIVTLLIIGAQAAVISALLVERRARRRAEAALRDQTAYERTMAELATDAVRYAPEDAPRALENALARVGFYAGADAAMLLQYDESGEAASRLCWTRHPSARSDVVASSIATNAARLEVPLIVAGTKVGILELYSTRVMTGWSASFRKRIVAGAEVIAGAIARSRATEAAGDAQRQVAHLGRVAIVGELGSTISHELRQPLTAIRANAEFGIRSLGSQAPDVAEVRQAMKEIVDDAARATATIEHIRSMLRMRAPVLTGLDINEVARQAASLLQRDAMSRGVRLELAFDTSVPHVLGNAIELQQVIINLIMNAFDAVASVAPASRAVILATRGTGSLVELTVHDTGVGLSSETLPHVFDAFFTTKEHGLGMGLSIVRTLVEKHGGSVYARNDPAGGAIFGVTLPSAPPRPPGAHSPALPKRLRRSVVIPA